MQLCVLLVFSLPCRAGHAAAQAMPVSPMQLFDAAVFDCPLAVWPCQVATEVPP